MVFPGVEEGAMSEVEDTYQKFWAPIVEKDGVPDMEQIKKELFDYRQAMDLVPRVYDALTGGRCSKILTDPDVVIALCEEYHEYE